MTRYIKRHSLQTRLTHDTIAVCCILLALSGLFVFIPPLAAAVPQGVILAIRISHRVFGVLFILVPLISAITAPKGVMHLLRNYFAKWDKDDVVWMKRFIPYMLGPKKVHMPDQHEVKSGQRVADGAIMLGALVMIVTGALLIAGTSGRGFHPEMLLVIRLIHDVGFFWICVFGIAHIYLGSGLFQPYRRTARLMWGDGKVSESDALYHWGHWACEEIEKGEQVSDDGVEDPRIEKTAGEATTP